MSAPTDLELMMYYDDELGAERRAEVEAWLVATDGDAPSAGAALGRAKLAGLEQVSLLMREHTSVTTQDVDLVDAIMRGVEQSSSEPAPAETAPAARPNGASPKVLTSPKPAPRKQGGDTLETSGAGAANDNGRLIFVLAAVAAVAAAAMFYWGGRPSDGPVAARPGAETPVLDAAKTTPTTAASVERGPAVASTAQAEVDSEESPSVEVASVDFGKRSGAIYYVAGASQGATTPVVWLSDE